MESQNTQNLGGPVAPNDPGLDNLTPPSDPIQLNESILRRSFRSVTLQKKPAAPAPPKSRGPLGLQLLHSPSEPLIDFVFVHGLRGGSVKTWAKSGNLDLYWPKAWLTQEPAFQNARIHSFGYNSDWGDSTATILDINDFGRNLYMALLTSPELSKDKSTPIVFVGHSMGGLVMKKAYLIACQQENEKQLADRIQCMFFLATPHRGSDAAKMLDRILRISTLTSKPYVADLQTGSATVTSINKEFQEHSNKLQLWSFYESLKSKKAGISMMVVERESAIVGAPHEHVSPLNADHPNACKFKDRSDPNYIAIRNALALATNNILGGGLEEEAEQTRTQLAALESFLLIQNHPEDELYMIESKKVAGSCQWITDTPSVTEWLSDSSEQPMMAYWLSGQPGAGKSMLVSHLVRHVGGLGFEPCFYFFREGRRAQQTVCGFLRSLAFQMAVIHSSVREALNELRESGAIFDKDDERVIWRKLFIQCILPLSLDATQVWIIDGLDECLDIGSLFSLITRCEASYPIKLLLGSRRLPELEKSIFGLDSCFHHHIEIEDTASDIKLLIEARSEDLLEDHSNPEELIDKIVAKSSGIFLWVELACDEINDIFLEAEIDEALEHMPAGMAPLYTKILDSMTKHTKHSTLIQTVLEWAVCASRSLTVEELEAAIAIDRKSRVGKLRKFIHQFCGQLLQIDQNGVIHMIHGTAREFLLGLDSTSPFSINKAEANERMATVCLEYLTGSEMAPPRHPMMTYTVKMYSEFADYASMSWSEHLMPLSAVSDTILALIQKFFTTNVLAWAEYIIRQKRNLYYLATAARNLSKCLSRYSSSTSNDTSFDRNIHDGLQQWTTDLVRVVLKFGDNILRDPGTLHFIVPGLCPKDSKIFQQFSNAEYGPQVQGLTNTGWEDCVSYIDYQNSHGSCLASRAGKVAIGMRSGIIQIYDQATCQLSITLEHGEWVKRVQFDQRSEKLVSCGRQSVKMWAMDGTLLWSKKLRTTFSAVSFVPNPETLLVMDELSRIYNFKSRDGVFIKPKNTGTSVDTEEPEQIVATADICPEGKLIALAYKGKPAQIWSTDQGVLIKECHMSRDMRGVRTMPVSKVLFNPNPEIELLAIAHTDLELSIFHKWSGDENEVKAVHGSALILAATPDGQTLATGDTRGIIRLWDFKTLTLIYWIQSYEWVVKSLAFSDDGLRIFDIRDTKTKVWEPSVLRREKTVEESEIIEPEKRASLDYRHDVAVITCIAVPAKSGCILAGRSDGSVAAYDLLTGTKISKLFTSHSCKNITNVAWSTTFMACSVYAHDLEVYDLSGSSKDTWCAAKKAWTYKPERRVLGLEMHSSKPLLLIIEALKPFILNLENETEYLLGFIEDEPGFYGGWVQLCLNDETIHLLAARKNQVIVFSFDNGEPSFIWNFRYEGNVVQSKIGGLHCSEDGAYVSIILTTEDPTQETPKLLVYKVPPELSKNYDGEESALETDPILVLPTSKVQTFYGFYRGRAIFLDHDLWIWSANLLKAEQQGISLDSVLERHFFVIKEFIGASNGIDALVTGTGTIVFPKEADLAVASHVFKWPYVGDTDDFVRAIRRNEDASKFEHFSY